LSFWRRILKPGKTKNFSILFDNNSKTQIILGREASLKAFAFILNQGNVEAAFQELNKATLKPFLMRIWGQAEPGEVSSGSAVPREKG